MKFTSSWHSCRYSFWPHGYSEVVLLALRVTWAETALHLAVPTHKRKGSHSLSSQKMLSSGEQRTRDKWGSPTVYSAVCSEHFTEDCFQPLSVFSKKIGLKRRQLLKPTAIPTIFKRPKKRLCSSSAADKIGRTRVSMTTQYLLWTTIDTGWDISSKHWKCCHWASQQ